MFCTSKLCCPIKRSVYYPKLKNLTFLLILTFRGQACQPTATATIRPQSICFSYKCQIKKKKTQQCHRTHLLLCKGSFSFLSIKDRLQVACYKTDSIYRKTQPPLTGPEAKLITFSAE